MGRVIATRGITNESGYIANVNASGQLAVDASVSVGAVTTSISGETVYLAGTDVAGNKPLVYIASSGAVISGVVNKLIVGFSGETAIAKISGQTVTVSNLSGTPVSTSISGNIVTAKTSGETNISKISGQTIIALISGQTVVTSIDLSGVTLNVDSVVVNISGQVVVAKTSGQSIRFGTSGFSYSQLQSYDYTNSAWVDVASDESGVVSVNASVSAEISGDTVRLWQGSGHNGVFLTSQSGNVFSILDDSGRIAVTTSGVTVSVVSGTGVRVSGETITVISGTGVRVSGETVSVTSGTGVRVSGESVIVRSGQIQIMSGAVTISGNVVVTSVSGNVISTSVSGNILTATNAISGNSLVGGVTSHSGDIALMTADIPKSVFIAYNILPVTAASGGTALLSGNSRVISIKNIGQSGTKMFVGSSGTNQAPWIATAQSGRGWLLNDGDAVTIGMWNPAMIRVVSLTSGQPVSYAINNY